MMTFNSSPPQLTLDRVMPPMLEPSTQVKLYNTALESVHQDTPTTDSPDVIPIPHYLDLTIHLLVCTAESAANICPGPDSEDQKNETTKLYFFFDTYMDPLNPTCKGKN